VDLSTEAEEQPLLEAVIVKTLRAGKDRVAYTEHLNAEIVTVL
jgi:hypothetical protein